MKADLAFLFGVSLVAMVGPSSSARAQAPAAPAFQFEKPPEKEVDWKVQAKGGLLVTTGNSQSRNGTLSLNGSRQAGSDKVSLEAMVAYGRSRLFDPVTGMVTDPATMMPGTYVTSLSSREETTTNQWRARGRYDRFLTTNNSAYALGQIGADRVAGKSLFGGGQVGYSRQVYKSDQHTAVAELGYDLSFERYRQAPGKTIDPVTIHSARLFAGDLWALTPETGINLSFEALFNLNEEKALDASDETGATKTVKAFKDTRLVGKAGLTTTLRKNLSFGFGFTLRYDQNPAPRPLPGSAKGLSWAPNFQPFSDKVDTLTEATLVFTFL